MKLQNISEVTSLSRITTAAEANKVIDYLVTIKRLIKEAEEVKKEEQAPFKAAVAASRKIATECTKTCKPLKEAEEKLKGALATYEMHLRESLAPALSPVPTEVELDARRFALEERQLESDAIQFRRAPVFIVDDWAVVPAAYLKLDEKACADTVRAGGSVPGVRVEYDLSVAVSTDKGFAERDE